MTNQMTLIHIEKTIVCTKAFLKEAGDPTSNACRELVEMMNLYSTYKVVEREIKKNDEKKTYKKLTFDVMKDYIKTQPDSEKQLIKFEAVKKVAKAKNSLYPLTKKWFLNAYPEYKANSINDKEMKELVAEAEKEAEYKTTKAEKETKLELIA